MSEYIKVEECLIKGSHIGSSSLRTKLIREGYKENKCEVCGLTVWNNKPITCQLHHINGDNTDNRLENLQILCPNCHSQTDNYCGHSGKTGIVYRCKKCGKVITKGANYCENCYHFSCRKEGRPTKEQLILDIKNLKSNVAISKKYNVSNTAIRKWRKSYNL